MEVTQKIGHFDLNTVGSDPFGRNQHLLEMLVFAPASRQPAGTNIFRDVGFLRLPAASQQEPTSFRDPPGVAD